MLQTTAAAVRCIYTDIESEITCFSCRY